MFFAKWIQKQEKISNQIPNKTLFETDIKFYSPLFIPNFIVYLIDVYINLDDLEGVQKRNKIFYFDSFGDLPPPKEITSLAKNCKLYYNTIISNI